jgi:hypothetical protein
MPIRYLLIFFLVLSGYISPAQPTNVKLRMLEGYYPLNGTYYHKGPNLWVITDQKTFDRYFGVINKPGAPDFEIEMVLVMTLPPTKRDAKLSFEKIGKRAGSYIEVYCDVQENLGKLPYVAYPTVVAAIPIYFKVSHINFYEAKKKKKLMKSVQCRRL